MLHCQPDKRFYNDAQEHAESNCNRQEGTMFR